MVRENDPIDWSAIPDYFCPECTALRFAGEPSCSICDSPAPPDGWVPLAEADDPYLGCVMADQFLITKRDDRRDGASIYRAESLDDDQSLTIRTHDVTGAGGEVDDAIRRKLADDVLAAQMLNNPYVAPIYELLELSGGTVAVVTEYIPGPTAREVVEDEGPLEVARAVDVASQLADGLADAHLVELLHGDLHPRNVEIAGGPGDRDVAFLFGFGPSGFVSAEEGDRGAYPGDTPFASPEQSETGRRTIRSDVYSLGATLFYLLTGRPPFVDEKGLAAHRRGERPAPRVRDVAGGREIPDALDDTIARMLAVDPLERPGTAGEVIYTLRSCVDLPEQIPVEAGQLREESDLEHDEVLLEAKETIPPPGGGSDSEREARPRRESDETGAGVDVLGLTDGGRTSDDPNQSGFKASATGTSEYDTPPEQSQVPFDELSEQEGHQERIPETSRLGPESSAELESEVDAESLDEETAPGEGARPKRFLRVATVDGSDFVVSDVGARLWRGRTGDDEWELLRHLDEPVVDFALTRSSVWLALGSGSFRRVSLEDGSAEDFDSPLQSPVVSAIAAASDGSLVVAGTQFGALVVGDAQDNWTVPDTSVRRVRACAVSADGSRIAVGDAGGRIGLFDRDSISRIAGEMYVDNEIVDLAFSEDNELLGVSQIGGDLTIHAVEPERCIAQFQEEQPPQGLFFAGDKDLQTVRLESATVLVGSVGASDDERQSVVGT